MGAEPGLVDLAPARAPADQFRVALAAVRSAALAVGVTLATRDLPLDGAMLAWLAVLAVHTAALCWRPLPHGAGPGRTLAHLVVDAAVPAVAVTATGGWESPFLPSLLVAVIVAGLARGPVLALPVALAQASVVALLTLEPTHETGLPAGLEWLGVSVLVALVAGFARRLAVESAQQRNLAEERLQRLVEANDLLAALHRVTQTLPSSLDLDDVLDSAVARTGELFDHRGLTLLLCDDGDGALHVARAQHPAATPLFPHQLPPPLRRVLRSTTAVAEPDLSGPAGPGVAPGAASGVYAALRSRGMLVGVLALEHDEPGRFDRRDAEVLDGLTDAIALAVDNARWFGRLRTMGADEERSRIARELHDRVGQALAYLGFELDRLVKRASADPDLLEELDHLRGAVREVTGEVRETLYDLRTTTSEDRGVGATLAAFCSRVEARSDLRVRCEVSGDERLPPRLERDVFRIAAEAVTNAERHARAGELVVRWRSDRGGALLEVVDDGIGLQSGERRADAYGVVGMRERAASIGARLELEARPGGGTVVRCTLPPPDGELRRTA